MRTSVLLLTSALLLALPALAQDHPHETGADGEHFVVLHDGPPSGRAVVGSLTHFGFALVDASGAPVRHHDAEITLTQNDVVLFASKDTHEYDGLFTLDWVFATPGPYAVHVVSDTKAVGHFNGTAVLPVDPIKVTAAVEVPPTLPALSRGSFRIALLDEAGKLVEHSDALFEVRRIDTGHLAFRTHFHTHDAPMTFELGFAEPGDYEARVLGFNAFPTGTRPDYAVAYATAPFTVSGVGGGGAISLPPLAAVPTRTSADARDGEGGGDFVLTVITDPADRNGPFNHQRLSAFVWDVAAAEAAQHVNFNAVIAAAGDNRIFESASLHEYDGHLEVVMSLLPPGLYTFTVEAERGEWKGTAASQFVIAPPVVPIGAGPLTVVVSGTDALVAGVPADLTFSLETIGGVVVPHSEIDFEVRDTATGIPVAAAKIHTHMEAPRATVTFPTAGTYLIVADGDTLEPSPTVYFDGTKVRRMVVLEVTVAEGPGLPEWLDAPLASAADPADAPVRFLPGLSAFGALAATALALVLRRR